MCWFQGGTSPKVCIGQGLHWTFGLVPLQVFRALAAATCNKVLVDYGGFVHMSATRQAKSKTQRNKTQRNKNSATCRSAGAGPPPSAACAPTARSENSCRYSFAKTTSIRRCGFS